MVKKNKHKRNEFPFLIPGPILGIGGRNTLVGPGFILKVDSDNADIGFLDPKSLRTYDQDYVNYLINIEPEHKLDFSIELKNIAEHYVEQRRLLSDYHNNSESLIIAYDNVAAKELKNFDEYINKVVIRNEAELNVFYDYIILYRKIENKRCIINWNLQSPKAINQGNQQVVKALEKASFAILRLDENLRDGAIKVTNVINKKELLLIDKSLNRSDKEGCFFICSLLDMGNYVMTSGGGIPIDPNSDGGKSILTLSKKHLDNLYKAKTLNKNSMEAVREIYGFCLRSGTLAGMSINEI